MKTKLLFYLILYSFITNGQVIFPDDKTIYIPDDNFRRYLIETLVPECFENEMLSSFCASQIGELHMSGLEIKKLDGIENFTSLYRLDCSGNYLDTIYNLPNSIHDLNCGGNNFKSLSSFPENLELLKCGGNSLIQLSNLPLTLTELDCSSSSLQFLPTLPISLRKLDCSFSQITSFPSLTDLDNLYYLDCKNNKISDLTNLPNNLWTLICHTNNITCLPHLPEHLYSLLTDVKCIPNLASLNPSYYIPVCNANNNPDNCQLVTNIQDKDLIIKDVISYPNPVENGRLYVSNARGFKYKLNNVQGQQIMSGTVDETGLDVSQLNSGMYMLELGVNENKKVEKIVIR